MFLNLAGDSGVDVVGCGKLWDFGDVIGMFDHSLGF
jgi:hypothetical protein